MTAFLLAILGFLTGHPVFATICIIYGIIKLIILIIILIAASMANL